MKKILMIVCVGSTLITYAQKPKKPVTTKKPAATQSTAAGTALKTRIDSLSYAIGIEAASFYKAQGAPTLNADMVKKAFADVYANKTALTPEQTRMCIQQNLQVYMANKMQSVKEEGRTFLANNKKRPGVVELPNGLQYEIIKQGTGPRPKVTDTIKAHYVLALADGKELQSSYKNGEPIQMPVSGFIAGWVQALQMMPVGSKWKLYVPSDLGYGDRGAGNGQIPGGAVLVFDLELLDIVNK